MKPEANSRWWESYLVRYAIGTMVGALCVYALLDATGGDAKAKALMMAPVTPQHIAVVAEACKEANANACVAQLQLYQDLYGFNLPQLLLLGIYGLAFCYLASAPGLIAHAGRWKLISGSANPEKRRPCFTDFGFAALFVAACLFIPLGAMLGGAAIAAWLTLLVTLVFVIAQIALLIAMYREGNAVFEFYGKLHQARENPAISPDSYRHLREHGNAFFIVILEVMFFAVAMSVVKLFGAHPYWPALLALWVLPGAMVYFIGHRIEATMVERRAVLPAPTFEPPGP